MSSQICIDASIALRWILPTQQSYMANSLLQAWDKDGVIFISPPLFDVEVTSVIRKLVNLKSLSNQQGEQAYSLYRELEVVIVSPSELSIKAWRLAAEYDQVRTYAMQYIAVAELADCELWTADKKLFSSLKDKYIRLHFLGDYDTVPTATTIQAESKKVTRSDFPGLWRAM